MILTEEQRAKFVEVTRPVMEFLNGFHPHVEITITSTYAEFLEGVCTAMPESQHIATRSMVGLCSKDTSETDRLSENLRSDLVKLRDTYNWLKGEYDRLAEEVLMLRKQLEVRE